MKMDLILDNLQRLIYHKTQAKWKDRSIDRSIERERDVGIIYIDIDKSIHIYLSIYLHLVRSYKPNHIHFNDSN